MDDFYQILGVSPTSTIAEIRARYRFLAKAYHPDRFPDAETKRQAEEEMKRINLAYDVLSDARKRSEYDRRTAKNPPPASEKYNTDEKSAQEFHDIKTYCMFVFARWYSSIPKSDWPQSISRIQLHIDNLLASLLLGLYPSLNEPDAAKMFREAKKAVQSVVEMNWMLGVESKQSGSIQGFSKKDLHFYTALQYLTIVEKITQSVINKKMLVEKVVYEINEKLNNSVVDLCLEAFEWGRTGTSAQSSSQRQGVYQETQNSYKERPRYSSPSYREPHSHSNVGDQQMGICRSCGRYQPVAHVNFHQNIGLLIVRFHRAIEGNLCAECNEEHFWKMTGITLLLGWWGIISFFTTPFILIKNIVEYVATGKLRRGSYQLGSIAVGWKVTTIGALIAAMLFILNAIGQSYVPPTSSGQVYVAPAPTTAPQYTKTPKATPRPGATSTSSAAYHFQKTATSYIPLGAKGSVSNCTHWSNISSRDDGKYTCAYGIVKKAYWGDETFYMAFSDESNDFRIIVLGGRYLKDIEGNCVLIKGVVKTYDEMPYIEANEEIYKCK